jgi:hypothetical protein
LCLAGATKTDRISLLDNGSSLFVRADNSIIIQLKSIIDFLDEHKIKNVDLIKINIEGGEYELLEKLIEEDKISIFNNIQVQFHDFVIPNAKERMVQIQSRLKSTHFITYQFEFVWENWKKLDHCKTS